jgi:peroxiredoxin Q/BCP
MTKAFDFKLKDQNENTVSLSDFSGKWVVLYFYPKDDTPGCTKEACNFRDGRAVLEELGAVVIGISKDSVSSHKKFSEKYGLNFILLSDPDAVVIKKYGAWGEKSMFGKKYFGINRNTILIDPSGNIYKEYKGVNPAKHIKDIFFDLEKAIAN